MIRDNNPYYLRSAIIILLVLETIIYSVFMVIDILALSYDTIYLKYGSMLIILLFAFLAITKWDIKHTLYRLALCFTLLADLFLLVLGEYYEVGLVFFISAQVCYYLLINHLSSAKCFRLSLIIYGSLVATIFLILTIMQEFVVLYWLVGLYFPLLITNFIIAMIIRRKEKQNYLLPLGLFLFILCDINVGLNNLDNIINNDIMAYIISFAMWMFYLPSQVLICLGIIIFKEKYSHEEKCHQ